MHNMQVLQICHSYYPPFLDCARQYAALFYGTEHQIVTVYLTGEEDQEVARQTSSDTVIFLGYKSREVKGLKLGAISKLRKIIQQRDFAFCIAHRVKPTYVALLASRLPVVSVHHNYHDYTRVSRRWFINLFKRRLLMLGVSNSVRDDLRRDLKGWTEENIQTLYNRIDIQAIEGDLLAKSEARRLLDLPDDAWIIGNVGRLHYDKDQATLIKAFYMALPQLPVNSLLVIMGSGPLEHELKNQAKDLGLEQQVVFTGNILNARNYFKAFDLFALTSDREPFGMVLLEAMVAGLPIICSNCGGAPEIVKDIGDLFPFGNAEGLANWFIQNSVSVRSYQSLIREKLQFFSDETARIHFWKILKDLNFINKN